MLFYHFIAQSYSITNLYDIFKCSLRHFHITNLFLPVLAFIPLPLHFMSLAPSCFISSPVGTDLPVLLPHSVALQNMLIISQAISCDLASSPSLYLSFPPRPVVFFSPFSVTPFASFLFHSIRIGNFMKTIKVQTRQSNVLNKFYSRLTFKIGQGKIGKKYGRGLGNTIFFSYPIVMGRFN